MTSPGDPGEVPLHERAALFDFYELWHQDAAAGESHGLAHYLARFPECEARIAREYLRLTGSEPPSPSRRPDPVPDGDRYDYIEEIARGGMGVVDRVHDARLDRELARKSALRSGRLAHRRLENEARLTGRLDHPGIVPVHDVGRLGDGTPWFTMQLISGQDLHDIIERVHADDREWSLAAALGVLLRVCETVAFAHSRGVVHRDLKPSNVRVGRFGEVYVLDWGLARAEDEAAVEHESLRVDRRSGDAPGTPLLTMDGDVLGTPSSMPPEQAAGHTAEIGPRSDVYAVGAMLYELLLGRGPYMEAGETITTRAILQRVLAGPPRALHVAAPEAPAELVAICEKAMSREPARRYRDMGEMASDLRAYLEGRVVRAYRTGVRAEFGKWVSRNRWLTGAVAAGLVVAVSLLLMLAVQETRNRNRLRLVADARAPLVLAGRARALASDRPGDAVGLRLWIDEATDLLSRLPGYERELERLKQHALPWDPEAPLEAAAALRQRERVEGFGRLLEYYGRELERMREQGGPSEEGLDMASVEARLVMLESDRRLAAQAPVERLTYAFEGSTDAQRFELIERLLVDVEPLLDSSDELGLVSLVRQREELARTIEERTLVAAAGAWERAIAEIADPSVCPRYEGLVLRPQLGLVPLGRQPATGLWEFVHLASGSPPELGADGALRLDEESGIVLVLLPGARVELGAQAARPEGLNYDPEALPDESTARSAGPELLHAILAPFFVGKYEVTQAQWRRIAGRRPSQWSVGASPELVRSGLHPVETVSWIRARRELVAVGLTLPTEAQWEYAARAGTATPWWTGPARESLRGAANLLDEQFVRMYSVGFTRRIEPADWPGFDDGFPVHAPVGSFRASGFGLFDVCGNVSEWCLDAGFIGYDMQEEVLIDTFERRLWGEGLRVRRGGSFEERAVMARSAARRFNGPEFEGGSTGLRAARGVER